QWVLPTRGNQEVILVSAQGQSIRFSEEDVRSMGLAAGGVGGMKLKKKDRIVYAGVVDPDGELLTVTAAGFGKRSPLAEYSLQGRNGGGIVTHKITEKTGEVAAALVLSPKADNAWLIFVTGRGQAKPLLAVEVPAMGRSVQGKAVVEISLQDTIAAVWRPDSGAQGEEPTPPLVEESKPAPAKKPATTPRPASAAAPPPIKKAAVKPAGKLTETTTPASSKQSAAKPASRSAGAKPFKSQRAPAKAPADRAKKPPGQPAKLKTQPQPIPAEASLAFDFIEQMDETKPAKTRKTKLSTVVSVPTEQVKAAKKKTNG
ncbi:MAG: DNA gyrase C-terminal beta-propeller domain-containing protein, partial [Caldilinea sp.]